MFWILPPIEHHRIYAAFCVEAYWLQALGSDRRYNIDLGRDSCRERRNKGGISNDQNDARTFATILLAAALTETGPCRLTAFDRPATATTPAPTTSGDLGHDLREPAEPLGGYGPNDIHKPTSPSRATMPSRLQLDRFPYPRHFGA